MKNFLITLFFGWFGLHKFMNRKAWIGILYLFTFGLFGIGWIYDVYHAFIDISKGFNMNSITLYVAGTHYVKQNITSILSINSVYRLSDERFTKCVPENKRIYKYKIKTSSAKFVPEPDNEHDRNALKVMIDNVHVGYIPADNCIEVKKIIKKVKSITATVRCGDCKYHVGNEVYKSEEDFNIDLNIEL